MTLRRRVLWFATGAALALALGLAGITLWQSTHRVIRITMPRREDWPQSPEALDAMFGGDAGLATVARPEWVEAYRIGPPRPATRSQEVNDYPIIAGPGRIATENANELSAALTSPKSYVWETAKGCEPEYGVCLSFFRGDNRVDVLLCFECNILLVAWNGSVTGGEDFDPVRPVLVRAVKAGFPADDVIQTLEEQQ